jgi:hypothetical protein
MPKSVIEKPTASNWSPDIDARGHIPESWNCTDCGVNTAPGMKNRVQTETALIIGTSAEQEINEQSEVYTVKPKVWKAASMEDFGGCLCIGCLEKRLGRFLTPKDFVRNNGLNMKHVPCTRRLQARREGLKEWYEKQPDGSFLLCQVDSNGEVTCRPAREATS